MWTVEFLDEQSVYRCRQIANSAQGASSTIRIRCRLEQQLALKLVGRDGGVARLIQLSDKALTKSADKTGDEPPGRNVSLT